MTGTATSPAVAPEQTRARYPKETGYVDRDGVRVFYEVYGEGDTTALLLPTWSIAHSRFWKLQIPYLARHCRVVALDGRGGGRSDQPAGAHAYTIDETVADALAVMDATGTARATLVGFSCGALSATVLAADHPERVDAIVHIGPAVALAPSHPERCLYPFEDLLDTDRGVGEAQPALLVPGLPGLPRVLLREVLQRAALDQADRGRHRVVADHPTRDARRHRARDRPPARRGFPVGV